ncbi:LPD38 domain-containing protein [Aeromonas enteropelogenes]|uniref:LPD38 domain-containing protein n=1 Tax=Aeromonas enteropelogenes TaxID=29489 RepID=UPI0005A8A5B5|nr:LPD38 domain-containing protein [Aeromonas enteropelogenes]UBH57061.1 LPD5 domain-containing protein [Aeromonas enteropelogenes]
MDKTTTMLPTAQQSDSRMDEFWDSLESGLASPVPPRNLDVGLIDVARATGAGGLELIGGIGELARQAGNYGRLNAGKDQGEYLQNVRASMANKLAPVMNAVAGIGELAQSGADSLKAGMSDDAKEALGRSLVSESPSGRTVWGEGAGDIDVWAMKMANGIGSLLPTLASGGITGLAAKATVGRMVTTSMMKRGVTQEVAELVASKTVSRLATGAAVTTGMTGSVGSAGTNARDAVLGMSFDELSNSTTFRDAFRRIDTDQRSAQFSDSEKLQMAREETANLASQATMGDAKTWGAAAVGTLMGDTMLFKMLAGKAVGGGMLRKVVKGAVGEGGSEAIEEGTQQLSVNEALSDVTGAVFDPYQGVVPAALEGGLIGAGVGGATGGIAGLRSDDIAAQDELASEANQPTPAQPGPKGAMPEPAAEPEVKQSPLGPSHSQFDELRDVPAYLRQDDTAERFKGMAENSEVQEALAEATAPTVDELLAQAKNQQPEGVAEPVPMGEEEVQAPVSPIAARIGPLNSLRVTKRGKPFASMKEALLASRKDMEVPVPLNGGGFGVAEIAEVERVKADQPNVAQTQQFTPAVDTVYRDVLHSNEQLEVAHDQPVQISAIGGERPGDQLGAGQPAAEGAGPASTELASRTGSGDQRNLAPPVPVPTGLQRDDQTLTTPATDAGVAVSEVTKPEPIPVTTPWAEAIDNPDGTITLQGELPLIKQWARNNGVKVIPGKGGLIVAKLSAGKVRQFAARAEVAPAPTEAQKEAGNYKKGHITLQGLDITLENTKGSTRTGTDQDGRTWQSTLAHDYGYIKRTSGTDGDQVDVFIGDQPDSETVFVVDQIDPRSGAFDEHKVMLGFADEAAARAGYLASYENGWQGLGAIKAMTLDTFKRWLNDGGTTKPVSVGRSERQNKIADFGEKIGGARKDTWSAYRDTIEGATTEQIKALPLSKAWPAPDYDKLLEAGVDRDAVAIARAARDAIPAKPRVSYKVRNWAQAVELLRDLSLGLMDGAVDIDTAKQEMSNANLRSAHAIQNRAELYQAVGHRRSLADLELSVGSYSLYDGVKYDPPKRIWTIRRASRSNVFCGWPRTIASGSNKAEVIAEFKRQYDQLTQEVSKPRAISFDIYSRHGQGWIVGKKIGRNHLDLTEAFERANDARKYRDDHYDELISKLEKAKKIPHERRDINQPRVGEDMRGGANVTPALFGQAFGFRGVEFGNWVEQRRRQRDLNDAYDALMDMAAVLGISPKALSLNGELGLAFGARGSGGVSPAAAHYEPGKVVINLTKMKGAGSLGHEWWHALDSYFARMREEPSGMMTEARDVSLAARESSFIHRGAVRREMIEAFGIVNRVIKQTALKERSRKLDDKRSKAYWTTDRELSARAFESYLIAKLQDQGASNDYLANIVSEAAWDAEASLGIRLDRSYPYPTAGEIPAIRSGFDQFFNTIEEREEGERRILFSKQAIAEGVKPVQHLTSKEADLVIREWFKRYQGARGINVQIHATQDDLELVVGLDTQPGLLRRAVFDGDTATLHVAADTVANPKRLREILRHEVIAHYGLANVLGGGEYTKLISRVIQSKAEPSMKDVWDWVSSNYADEDVGVQAVEIIAHLAELEQSAWRRGWDKVVSWVTQALRAVGFVPEGIKAAEVRTMIEALGKKLEGEGRVLSSGRDSQWFSQSNMATDVALEKLSLGPHSDIIDTTKANLAKLRSVDRGMLSSWLNRFIKKANTEVLDALAPIKYAEDVAGISDATESGYIAARMATGAASTMQATMLYGLPEWKDGVIQRKAGTDEKDALLGIFSDLGNDLHNWLGWMAGHRAEMLMEQGRENLLSKQDISVLKALGKGKEAMFTHAKARWNRLNAATLDLAQEAGLFTPEARAEFESEWYIPFFRESEDGDVLAPFKVKGIANQNAGIKKLKGGKANTHDLLENIFAGTSKLIDASMKNMAAQKTVWNLADSGIIEVVPTPNRMDWRKLKNGKGLITVKLEGEDYMIRVNDPDLYRAMTFFDRQPFGTMVNMAAKAKRLLTAGVTASPEFMLRNFLRDSVSSWAISKDGFKPLIDSIKGVNKTLTTKGSTLDVMFSGASFLGGYVNGTEPGAMADAVRKSLRRKGMTPEQITKYERSIVHNAVQAKGIVADVWDHYRRWGEALENANREAVYEAALKAGKSHAQAAFESKDLMDFSMLGASRAMQVMVQVLPFFNARAQGLGKLARELRDNPREIAKRAGMITAASLALLTWNWDDERYEALPDWDKDANWHFWFGEQHWRIPKPFEIGVLFGTIPERMARAMGDKDTGAQFGKAVTRAIGDTFALNPIPQIVKPMVEAAFNYDSFRWGPIENQQDLAVQAEARYNEQTSLLMRELGELTGFSPKQLEHLVIGYTGTMGSYVMAAADGLIRVTRPGESASWRADEIPLVKAVYRGTGPAKSTQHMEEFYRMLNEVNQLKRTVDQYRREGLIDRAKELLEEQGGILKARQSLSRTQQLVRALRNKVELTQRDKTLNAEEKRIRIDDLLTRRNELVYWVVNKNRLLWEE